mgnify:FL=1
MRRKAQPLPNEKTEYAALVLIAIDRFGSCGTDPRAIAVAKQFEECGLVIKVGSDMRLTQTGLSALTPKAS